jgi:hypothetical protein
MHAAIVFGYHVLRTMALAFAVAILVGFSGTCIAVAALITRAPRHRSVRSAVIFPAVSIGLAGGASLALAATLGIRAGRWTVHTARAIQVQAAVASAQAAAHNQAVARPI